jgi:hypothetical protein
MPNVNPDPKNPTLATISDPDPRSSVDPTAQNIKNNVQGLRQTLFDLLNPAPPGQDVDWRTSVRIIRLSGSDPAGSPHPPPRAGTYMPISSLPQKMNRQVDRDAQLIKRAMVSFGKWMIDRESRAGNLTGQWRTVVRIVPSDAQQVGDASSGCGCGCS